MSTVNSKRATSSVSKGARPQADRFGQLQFTLPCAVEQFLSERRSRGLSNQSVIFYQRYLRAFEKYADSLGVNEVEAITAEHLRNWMVLLAKTHNPGGVHGHFRCVRTLLNWYEEEYEPERWSNPIRKVKPPKVTVRPLPGVPIANVKRMVEACTTNNAIRDRAILLCLVDSGARAGEFLAMNLKDLDISSGALRIEHGKGDKFRVVFLGNTSRRSLRKWLRTRDELRPTSALWVSESGTRLTIAGLRQVVERRAVDAGVKVPGLHDFRRCFALTMLRNGVDLMTISRLLGHSSLAVTERYLCQDEEDLAEGHRRGSPVDNAW